MSIHYPAEKNIGPIARYDTLKCIAVSQNVTHMSPFPPRFLVVGFILFTSSLQVLSLLGVEIPLIRMIARQRDILLRPRECLARRYIDASTAVLPLPAHIADTAGEQNQHDDKHTHGSPDHRPLVLLDPAAHLVGRGARRRRRHAGFRDRGAGFRIGCARAFTAARPVGVIVPRQVFDRRVAALPCEVHGFGGGVFVCAAVVAVASWAREGRHCAECFV